MKTTIAAVAAALTLGVTAHAADAPGEVQRTSVAPHATTTLTEARRYPHKYSVLLWVYRDGKIMNSNKAGSRWSLKGVIVYADLVKGRARLRIANFTDQAHTITVRFWGLIADQPSG